MKHREIPFESRRPRRHIDIPLYRPKIRREITIARPPVVPAASGVVRPSSVASGRGDQRARPAIKRLAITTPAEELQPLLYIELLNTLLGLPQPLILEVAHTERFLSVSLIPHPTLIEDVERLTRGVATTWEIDVLDPLSVPRTHLQHVGWLSRKNAPDYLPLREGTTYQGTDPLSSILEPAMPHLPDEALIIRYLIRSVPPERLQRLQKDLTRPLPPEEPWNPFEHFWRFVLGVPRIPKYEARLQQLFENKIGQPGYEVVGWVILSGTSRERLTAKGRALGQAFSRRFDSGFGGLSIERWDWKRGEDLLSFDLKQEASLLLNCLELASLWHPPTSSVTVPGVQHLKHQAAPLPTEVSRAVGPTIGVHRYRGSEQEVRLSRDALHAGHFINLGATGYGKSTLAHRILTQLAQAADRPSVYLLDPHGTLAEDFMRRSISTAREREAYYLEFGEAEWPIAIPIFKQQAGVSLDEHVDSVFNLFKTLFHDRWSTTRMEDAVWAIVATLCSRPRSSLLHVPSLLTDSSFRRQALASLNDRVTLQFWADYERLSDSAQQQVRAPILSRLRGLYRSRPLRNIFCQLDGPDLSSLADEGTLVSISLAGREIAAEANLLGELLIARVYAALTARLRLTGKEPRRLYFGIDESHRYKGTTLPAMLREARKMSVSLLLSTQYIASWSEQLAEAVLGNPGQFVTFQCGPEDAHKLTERLSPFSARDLQSLDRFEAVAKLTDAEGISLPTFRFRTLPVTAPADDERLERIRVRTRERFCRPRAEVEAELDQLMVQTDRAGGNGPSQRRSKDTDDIYEA